MKILFRADAKPSVGTGDLLSLVNLSHTFRERGWDIYFAIQNHATAIKILEEKTGNLDQTLLLKLDGTVDEETEILNNYINEHGIDTVTLEITQHPHSDYVNLNAAKVKTCVDFFGNIDNSYDLVVNWDVDADKLYQTKGRQARFLLGPENVILPPEFLNFTGRTGEPLFPPEKILITMGGADIFDYTSKVVQVISDSFRNIYKIQIILGPGYEKRAELEKLIARKNLPCNIDENVSDMLSAYLNCDLAISAGGLTAFELIAAGTPSILIPTYKHQVKRCAYFGKRGVVKYIGGLEEFDRDELMRALEEPIAQPSVQNFGSNLKIEEAICDLLKGK